MCECIIEVACSAGTSRVALQPVGSPTLLCWWLRCNPGFEICRGSRERWINFRSRILAPLPLPTLTSNIFTAAGQAAQPHPQWRRNLCRGVYRLCDRPWGRPEILLQYVFSVVLAIAAGKKIFTRDPAMPRASVNTVNGHGDDLPIRNFSQYRADV